MIVCQISADPCTTINLTSMRFAHENVSFHNYTYNEYINNDIRNLQLNGASDFKLSNIGVANTFLRIIFGKHI